MGLLDRLQRPVEEAAEQVASLQYPQRRSGGDGRKELLSEFRGRIQDRLLERIDLRKLEETGAGDLLAQITSVIDALIKDEGLLLTDADRERLVDWTTADMLGLGPLEPLLQDNEISDILVNGSHDVWIERKGRLYRSDVHFHDDRHLMAIINRIVGRVGRRIDESSPMVDARLPDGSRVNAIIPPLAIDGPGLSIRRFGGHRMHVEDLIRNRSLTAAMAEYLRCAVASRLNVLISGGTGSGKTTLLNCLSSMIPEDERILTIEDAAELALQQPHVFRMETRPPNVEGKGEVTQRDLVRNSLRMRPDRIIVGEVRGAEVLDMLQAMSTGHDGSLATIHANNPRDALNRLQMMMTLSGVTLPEQTMRQYISSSIHLLVHATRMSDGSRKIVKISEVTGSEGETLLIQDLFEFVRTGIDSEGRTLGTFRVTGVRSFFADRMEAAGFSLPADLFHAQD